MHWAARYVGLPFADGGRDFVGVDCWGLVQLVMRHEKGIALPCYGETSALDLAAVAGVMARESLVEPWQWVEAPRPFDVVVMHRRRDPVHVGIMASADQLLHIEQKIAAVLLPLDHPTLRFRNPRFLRHHDLR
jgi:cell wall-associated NlpC family hydrolase